MPTTELTASPDAPLGGPLENPEIELLTGQLTVEECVSRIVAFLADLEKQHPAG